MGKNERNGIAWWCASTILLSAFLLFQVQPMISKMILPWFGGSPAVWSTCMLFFQVLLLAGYAYAHWLAKLPRATQQATIHAILLVTAIVMLPVVPPDAWKPKDSSHPTTQILFLLGRSVGLPYFLLSATGPLVQFWFGRACPGRSPYRLYSLSNIGSLGALLTYPFVFEPWLRTSHLGWMWSVAFAAFAIMCGGLGLAVARIKLGAGEYERRLIAESEAAMVGETPRLRQFLTWLGLAALGSTALLTITNHLCEDVAVVPFMWILPLSIYLISFIICFDNERWYSRRLFSLGAIGSLLLICYFQVFDEWAPTIHAWNAEAIGLSGEKIFKWLEWLQIANGSHRFADNILWQAGAYVVALFCICMLCHGELVRKKPAPRHLTAFYLMTSAGGAAGGILVALVCPRIFQTHFELNLALMVSYALAVSVWMVDSLQRLTAPYAGPQVLTGRLSRMLAWLGDQLMTSDIGTVTEAAHLSRRATLRRWSQNTLSLLALPCVAGGLLLVAKAQISPEVTDDLVTVRNFYGVLHVKEKYRGNENWEGRELVNGRIIHGFQFTAESMKDKPTTYYTPRSGVGLAVTRFPQVTGIRVGVVGLGVGTMASYGKAGDYFRFYEINSTVLSLARNQFTYLGDCPATVEVALGDARLSMEQEEPQRFDVIVLDAFSSDAIPVHLLTVEAFDIYLKHLNPNGVIAVHTSNRHLDLVPVVVGLSKHHGMKVVMINNDQELDPMEYTSDWLLVTRSEEFLNDPEVIQASSAPTFALERVPIWTDQYSNLFEILKDAPQVSKVWTRVRKWFGADSE